MLARLSLLLGSHFRNVAPLRVKGCKGSDFPRDKQEKFLHSTISPPGKWLSFGSSLTRATREGKGGKGRRKRTRKERREPGVVMVHSYGMGVA